MSSRPAPATGWWLVPLAFAALKLVLHALAIGNYGYFRDELYYLACSRHLAWGYVDQPPFSIALLALVRVTLGESLVAIRALPALAGAATVFLVGALVRDLGGGRRAQALACLCAVLAPVYLAVDHYFSMNAFDTLFWTLSAWLLLRTLDAPSTPRWLVLGLVVGAGLLNKISLLWWLGGVALGLVVSPRRRVLLTPGPWLAAALAVLVQVPHVLWQVRNDWPTLEFMRNATQHKMVRIGALEFWRTQAMVLGPSALIVWVPGLVALLRAPRGRVLGVAFVAVAALLMASGTSRPNYLAVAYAPLFAAGAVAFERASAARGRAWLMPAALACVLLLGLPVVPMGLPLLPVERQVAYMQRLGVRPRAQEHTREGPLPQVFADMFGWPELAERVARVWRALPPEERAKASLFATNYGEAGALDLFGPRLGLPPAISPHNNYWLWGPRGGTGEVVIVVGGSPRDPHADFRSVALVDSTSCRWCMPYEDGAPIFVCRGLDRPLATRWREIRHYE